MMQTTANLDHYPTLTPFPVGTAVRYHLGMSKAEGEVIGYDAGRVVIHIPHYGNKRVAPDYLEPIATATPSHRQADCPGRPTCTSVHTLAELSAPAPAPLAARLAPGSILALDDLRHRAMVIAQAPHDQNAVRDLANVLQDVIGELIRRKAAEDGTA